MEVGDREENRRPFLVFPSMLEREGGVRPPGVLVAQQSRLARGSAGSAGKLRPGREDGKGFEWGALDLLVQG